MKQLVLTIANENAQIISNKTINYICPVQMIKRMITNASKLVSGALGTNTNGIIYLENHDMMRGDKFTLEAYDPSQNPLLFMYKTNAPSGYGLADGGLDINVYMGTTTYSQNDPKANGADPNEFLYIAPIDKNSFNVAMYPLDYDGFKGTTHYNAYAWIVNASPNVSGNFTFQLYRHKNFMKMVSEYKVKPHIFNIEHFINPPSHSSKLKLAIRSFKYTIKYPANTSAPSFLILKGVPIRDLQSNVTYEKVIHTGFFYNQTQKSISETPTYEYINKNPYLNCFDIEDNDISWIQNGFSISIHTLKYNYNNTTSQTGPEIIYEDYEGNTFALDLIIFYE